MAERFYSLSSQIETERKQYYGELEKHQRGSLDITGWLDWFLGCLERAIHNAEHTLKHVLFKAAFWDEAKKHALNERQLQILHRMLASDFKGHMNTSKYAKMTKCSTDTALRDIQHLKNLGLILQNESGGRSTSYRLANH